MSPPRGVPRSRQPLSWLHRPGLCRLHYTHKASALGGLRRASCPLMPVTRQCCCLAPGALSSSFLLPHGDRSQVRIPPAGEPCTGRVVAGGPRLDPEEWLSWLPTASTAEKGAAFPSWHTPPAWPCQTRLEDPETVPPPSSVGTLTSHSSGAVRSRKVRPQGLQTTCFDFTQSRRNPFLAS